jgi:hypothetical protein
VSENVSFGAFDPALPPAGLEHHPRGASAPTGEVHGASKPLFALRAAKDLVEDLGFVHEYAENDRSEKRRAIAAGRANREGQHRIFR